MKIRALGLCVLLATGTAACVREATAPIAGAVAYTGTTAAHDNDNGQNGGEGANFERFAVGAIQGQFDWKSLGGTGATPPANPADTHCAVYDHVIADNSLIDAPHSFGRRSLRISNAVTSGCYADHTFSARAADPAGQTGATSLSKSGLIDYALPGGVLRNHFEAEWTFASVVPDAQQPGLEVVVSPARGDDHRMSWVQMADLADGIAIVFGERSDPADPGAILRTTVASGLKRNDKHTVRLTMDFVDGPGNDVVRVYVDGKLKHTGRSWETYYALEPNGKLNFNGNPPAVNRLMFRTGSDAHRGIPGAPAPGTLGKGFVFDDVRVETSHGRATLRATLRDR